MAGSRLMRISRLTPALARHSGDSGYSQQPLRDGIVDEPAQLLERHVVGANHKAPERAAPVLTTDIGFEDALGQVAANLRHRIAHVVDRAVGRRADGEFDDRSRNALDGIAGDMFDVADRRHRALDALGDLLLHLGRRSPGLRYRDLDDREADVGILVDRHAIEADDPEKTQDQKQHDREGRVLDRPAGHVTHRAYSAADFAATTGLTVSPGDRKAPALSTMRSVPDSPAAMLSPCALTSPTLTARRTTLPSAPTA